MSWPLPISYKECVIRRKATSFTLRNGDALLSWRKYGKFLTSNLWESPTALTGWNLSHRKWQHQARESHGRPFCTTHNASVRHSKLNASLKTIHTVNCQPFSSIILMGTHWFLLYQSNLYQSNMYTFPLTRRAFGCILAASTLLPYFSVMTGMKADKYYWQHFRHQLSLIREWFLVRVVL